MTADPSATLALRQKLNLETARLPWTELIRHFAAGKVIAVSETLDLIDVAVQIAQDNTAQISAWMAQQKIGKVSDDQAQFWLDDVAQLWAVVVNPWVLVQLAPPKVDPSYH